VMARHGGDVTLEPLGEMLEGHARIRGLVMRLSDEVVGGKVRSETLREIGEQLEAHVRLEERVVFSLIEGSLPEAALTELAARLEAKEAGPRVANRGSPRRSSRMPPGRVPATARAATTDSSSQKH
jgi:hemerythrin-like domain-containing protein